MTKLYGFCAALALFAATPHPALAETVAPAKAPAAADTAVHMAAPSAETVPPAVA